jgi:DNA-binding beta-propeller fold protein YncE
VWVGGGIGVSVVDTATRTVVATVDGVRMSSEARVVFSGTRAYVPGDGIIVVDVPSRTKLGHVEYEGFFQAFAAAPNGRILHLAVGGSLERPMVRVFDAATTFVIAEIPLGAAPRALAVAPMGARSSSPPRPTTSWPSTPPPSPEVQR